MYLETQSIRPTTGKTRGNPDFSGFAKEVTPAIAV